MGFKVSLYSSSYPERKKTLNTIGIDISDYLDGFMEVKGKDKRLPFLGIYQGIVDSYFSFRKFLKHDFVLITGGGLLIPRTLSRRVLVYVHYITDYPKISSVENKHHYPENNLKKAYYKPWMFISNNLGISYGLKGTTIITNSNYTKNAIKEAWNLDSTVIYPPCPQYSFPLSVHENRTDTVSCIGRFTPEKNYEMMIQVAKRLVNIRFEFVGGCSDRDIDYVKKLMRTAPGNIIFHVNATISEKIDILKRSKVFLHGFVGEPFGIALIEAMSAGLVTVTHDSGAAKVDGLVPKNWRYDSLDGAVGAVSDAMSSWNGETAIKMREYAKRFSQESFKTNLKNFLSVWVRSMNIAPA